MFELEDFDLDDEVFLNTQVPTVSASETSITSNFKCIALDLKDQNKSSTNVSNSVFDLESSRLYNVEQKKNLSEKPNKNKANVCDNITNSVLIKESKSINEYEKNKNKIHFEDEFDSDDDAFFTAPDILNEPLNSSNIEKNTTKLNIKKDQNQCVSSSSNSECHESIFNSSKIKSSYKSNYNRMLNTTVTSVKIKTPKCASRKFPGPAGLLSENENLHLEDPLNLESLDMSTNNIEKNKTEEDLCIQANNSSYNSSPYQQFLTDFSINNVNSLLDKYNVAWIKQKLLPYTASGRFYTDKIPFFVSVLKEIDCLSPDPTVILADKTGHIRGTIHRAVWNQFYSQLKLGAVIVLSKVGVSCQKIVKGFTLNITSDHLIAIYSFSSENNQEVIVTRTTDLTNEEIVNNAKRWNILNSENLIKTPLNNLKTHVNLLYPSSQLSDTNYQTHVQLTTVNSFFKPKTSVAHNLFKNNSSNLLEEPPAKRLRNEKYISKLEENYSNHEMSIIENIFEGIDEDEMFNDFCC